MIQKDALQLLNQGIFDKFLSLLFQSGALTLLMILLSGCQTLSFSGPPAKDGGSPIENIIYFYQEPLDHLSAVRFGGCPMYPNCSEYALQSIHKHGLLLGWFMTCDRLMRCGRDEIDLSSEIIVNGKAKCLDTVESNDEWFAAKKP